MSAATVKQILCLANSRKRGGRCVIGKEMLPDRTLAWVRPVSDSPQGEVTPDEIRYDDGSQPAILDVIEIPVTAPKPLPYQPENWLIAPGQWRRDRRADLRNADRWVDPPETLWMNGFDSARGRNDRFPYSPQQTLGDSARFIRAPALTLHVSEQNNPDTGSPRRELRGEFDYEGNRYTLRITDIAYEEHYQDLETGIYQLGKCYLTVTVGEPFRRAADEPEYHYKLIAAILEEQGGLA